MKWIIKTNQLIEINGKEMRFRFSIKTVLDLESVLVVYLAPTNEHEYLAYIEFTEKRKMSNLIAINGNGVILWQFSNRFIAGIKKSPHKSPLIILDNALGCEINSKYDLLIDCQGWNLYVNPETGEKIREEQTK